MLHLFVKLFGEGGWVLYPIFGVSVLALYIAFGKALAITQLEHAHRAFCASVEGAGIFKETGSPALDRLVREIKRHAGRADRIERAAADCMAEIAPQLDAGMATIGACVVIAPLLGLLGTISGMNRMFDVIGRFGFGNPTIMSNGISMALQATLTGLTVAVAALLFQDFLSNRKSRILHRLDSDITNLVRRAEKAAQTLNPTALKEHAVNPEYRLLPDQHEKPEINLAPFVDTMMILLIFFVVTANLYVETGVDVTKPKAQTARPVGQKSILVGITREGTVHLYGRQVSLDRLKLLMEQETAKQQDVSVVIIADRYVATGRTVEVMDQCSLGGVQKISIAAGKE